MAKNYVCQLDGEKGNILGLTREHLIFLVNRGDTIQFQIEGGTPFCQEQTILQISENSNDPTSHQGRLISNHWVCTVDFSVAGSIKLSLLLGDEETQADYLIVSPTLFLGGIQIPIEGICFQTALSRNLGSINTWAESLRDQQSLGYNFFHITPIQSLGGSQSLYCIKDTTQLNPQIFPGNNEGERMESLTRTVKQLEAEGIGCIVDIVLNHCAFDSEFVEQHPEATYNLENSPYLAAAYCLDKALHEFSRAVSQKSIRNLHNRNRIETEKDLNTIMQILKLEVLPPLFLHHYFQIDVSEALKKLEQNEEVQELSPKETGDLKSKGLEYFIRTHCLLKEGEGKFSVELNTQLVWKACKIIGHSREHTLKEVKKLLPIINSYLFSRFDKHFAEILTNIEGDIRYHKIEQCRGEITMSNPLVHRYFQELRNGHVVLHNGFIMGNKEVMKDFAGKHGWHYFRRNVVVWADNIKLRYGNSYSDCPALWDTMGEYVRSMASVFTGLRLDNAHGTHIEVSLHMLREARRVNPNLFVMAELFTSDCKLDAHFVRLLGISGLVREAMSAKDPKQQGAQVYEYGNGETVSLGRLEDHPLNNSSLLSFSRLYRLRARAVPAIYYDCTHDNPTPCEIRKAHDALPSAAMISMTNCTIASSRGYDEFLAKQISVVTEHRAYLRFPALVKGGEPVIAGGIPVIMTFSHENTQKINTVEVKGDWDNWESFYALQRTSDTNFELTILLPSSFLDREITYKFVLDKTTWVHDWKQPSKRFGENINNYMIISREASPVKNHRTGVFPSLRPAREVFNKLHTLMSVGGYSEIYVHQCCEDMHMVIRQNPSTGSSYVMISRSAFWEDYNLAECTGMRLPGVLVDLVFLGVLSFPSKIVIEDAHSIKGLKGNMMLLTNLEEFGGITRDILGGVDVLNLQKVPQGFVCILKTELLNNEHIFALNRTYTQLEGDYEKILKGVSLEDLNHLLWRCSNEELDISGNTRDLYKVQGVQEFQYAGIGGMAARFLQLLRENSLGHEICNNIRAGDWLIDYIGGRLAGYLPEGILGYINEALMHIRSLPRGIIPKHLMKFILTLFEACKRYQIYTLFKVTPETRLEEHLYTSVSQFWGVVPSVASDLYRVSLSAGLPHFSTGFMRSWGRDTFIAFKGLLICTHRWTEAKEVILTFASVLRHGLIPNLLDSGKAPRYNSRDATWFFMHAVSTFVEFAPAGAQILKEPVKLVFSSDSQEAYLRNPLEITLSLAEILQKIMQEHATGISFREWNAGPGIDAHMREEGFNIRIKLAPASGFIHGGNRWNCGTWMDKLGSSEKAGNHGIPATPRDGAPIEITALLHSSLRFLISQHEQGHFAYSGVSLPSGEKFEYKDWLEHIQNSFESSYFIPEDPDMISGYYKDTVGSQTGVTDLQLRPNICIAMAVAPQLFDRAHATTALEVIRKELMPGLGTTQIGMRTLNDADSAYRGFYDNANDSGDFSIAHGFSYHNGPEWVWPLGYYLQAVLEFTGDRDLVMKCLRMHLRHMHSSLWNSLPELTNKFGEHCGFSCSAQAWSVGTIIEVLQKLNN